jgi:hypothetical protein
MRSKVYFTSLKRMPNITYVSYLFSSPEDKVPIEERIQWLKPLFEMNTLFILFVDDIYAAWLKVVPVNVKLIVLDLEQDLATISTVRASGELKLPPFRDPEKHTSDYLTFLNCKAELLVIARPNVLTPYVAYIDSGISRKVTNITEITALDTDPMPLISLLGCSEVIELSNNYETHAWWYKEAMLISSCFILPLECLDEWYTLNMTGLKKHLSMGCLTWDVNIWVSFLGSVKDRVIWYRPELAQTCSGQAEGDSDTLYESP